MKSLRSGWSLRSLLDVRRLERELRETETRLQQIVDHMPNAVVFAKSLDGRYLFVSRGFERFTGVTREQVVGRTARDLFAPAIAEQLERNDRRVLEARRAIEFEEHVSSGGEIRVMLASKFPLLRESGEPYALCGVSTDITDRKRNEEVLRASEAQYRAIFNASADALVLRDAEFRIVDVNTTYERMTGYTRAEVLGLAHVIANPPSTSEQVRALHGRVLTGEPMQLETRLVHRDGSWRELELRGVPIVHRGQPHVLYMGRDITDRKRAEVGREALEAQLRQAQKMDAIGRLTGGIAHDFNNILTSVTGYVALAEERDSVAADPAALGYLHNAQAGCRRARDLIRKMMTFSRGQRGDRRVVELQRLVDEWGGLLRSTLPSTIELVLDLDPATLPTLVDPVQAEQVLLNLCINARDAMEGAGRIVVGVRPAEVRGALCVACRHVVDGVYVELAVQDNGPGIDPAVMDRIFEPFFTTKEVGKGSGMGLAIVHGVVHDHGGHVLVERPADGGARLRVLFVPAPGSAPRREDAAPVAPPAATAALAGRVLLVEDEPMVRSFVEELLTRRGLTVHAFADPTAADAWFTAHAGEVDLLLTDLTLPGLTGLDLARRVTGRRPGLPVILYSGYGEELTAAQMQPCGVVDLLAKPVDPARLLETLRRHLPGGG